MKCQKGQGLVEFAMVLPFLILIILGLIYIGLLFSDYIALNNVARTAARDAALISDTTWQASGYQTIKTKYITESKKSSDPSRHYLPNGLYTWDPSNDSQFSINYDTDSNGDPMVRVVLKAPVYSKDGGLYPVFVKVIGSALEELTITYEMRSEAEHTTE